MKKNSQVDLDPPPHFQCESPSKKRGGTYTYFIRVGGKLTFFYKPQEIGVKTSVGKFLDLHKFRF